MQTMFIGEHKHAKQDLYSSRRIKLRHGTSEKDKCVNIHGRRMYVSITGNRQDFMHQRTFSDISMLDSFGYIS